MKKGFKRTISMLLSVLILITSVFTASMTAYSATTPVDLEGSTFDVWADPNNVLSQEKINRFSTDKLSTLGGIKPFKNSSLNSAVYYLFLPSNADCNALTFWFNGTLTIDGVSVTSGVPTNALASINDGGITKKCTFIDNGSSHTVTCMKSGNVGSVFVDTVSGSMSRVYASSDHSVGEAGTVMVVQPDGTVDYMGNMDKIQGRGNATWSTSNEKNPFNIKLAESTSLLGMGKAKKWVLLANASDDTLLKNQITYDFAKYVGVKYQPVCKPVDLYVNQQYYGSYQLSEKVEIKSSRIDVNDAYENLRIANSTYDSETGAIILNDLKGTAVNSVSSSGAYTIGSKKYSTTLTNPTDITGGYLYELEISDRWIDENAGFCAYNKQCWVLKNCDYATKEMVDYSYDLLFALGSSVYNNGVVPSGATTKNYIRGKASNPAPASQYQGKRWSDILDSDSAVRYYLVEELFKNLDASTTSCYFFKDCDVIDSKLYAGPVWDMDKCYGYTGTRWGANIGSTNGWYAKNVRIYKYSSGSDLLTTDTSDTMRPLAFLGQLATQKDFWNDVERYWSAYFAPAIDILLANKLDPTGTLQPIAVYAVNIDKSANMNKVRFSTTGVLDNSYNASSTASTLYNWISGRRTWINNQISTTDIGNATVQDIPDQTYTGAEIKPQLSITHTRNGVQTNLQEGVDYTTEYTENVNAGIATVIIRGMGVYTGDMTKTFTINPISIEGNRTVTIDDYAYSGTNLFATVDNTEELGVSLNYQWYRGDDEISGANAITYRVTDADIGSNLKVVVSGDGQNVTGTLISNLCNVREGERPTGLTKTIASWDYDYTADADALASVDENDFIYQATSGENMTTSFLTASVNARSNAKLKWSGATDLYKNGDISNQAPVMGTSKNDSLAWGTYPYFETTVSTKGYESIEFSAKIGGTKKGPRDWKLQYSLDGMNYSDASDAYTITDNKTLEQAFNHVLLPDECENVDKLYIRIVACADVAINGINTIVGQLSGDATVNNIAVVGTSVEVVEALEAPSINIADGSLIFDDDRVVITDNNGGADIYYSIDNSEPQLFTSPLALFDSNSKHGDSVTVTAWAGFGEVISEVITATYSFAGVDLAKFAYSTYSSDVTNGAVPSVAGVYENSGRMTAYTDGKSQYVPLWREDKGSFCIAPDDGAKWSKKSGFTYKVSTAGYENITFNASAFTTGEGPNSVVLQYSLDGESFTDVTQNVLLSSNGTLIKAFDNIALPDECSNLSELYIRIATKENSTALGGTLHNNNSKGNLYVNNVVIAGEDSGSFKMPFTNKSSDYFGLNGTITYISPDNMPVKYAVLGADGELVQSGVMADNTIQLSTLEGFNPKAYAPYKVMTWVGEDDDNSPVNTRTYYFKGETITKFDYNSKSRPIGNYLSNNSTVASNTGGALAGTLCMMPNGQDKTQLGYSDPYGVKVTWAATNPFVATKNLDKPAGNGCWLIETSTEGYTNVTLNLEQISSNKAPRDWGIAYSTDGNSYTYVENSNVRAISNDAPPTSTVETYNNLPLPSACDNQSKLYIKVFINGGESVDCNELADMTKGNTGINKIELSGIAIPSTCTLTINAVEKDSPTIVNGNTPIDAVIKVNGENCSVENGSASVEVTEGRVNTIEVSRNGKTFVETRRLAVSGDTEISVAIVPLDYVEDGIINGKDYAYIHKHISGEKKTYLEGIFPDYLNYRE